MKFTIDRVDPIDPVRTVPDIALRRAILEEEHRAIKRAYERMGPILTLVDCVLIATVSCAMLIIAHQAGYIGDLSPATSNALRLATFLLGAAIASWALYQAYEAHRDRMRLRWSILDTHRKALDAGPPATDTADEARPRE